jgi:hypothetical protein
MMSWIEFNMRLLLLAVVCVGSIKIIKLLEKILEAVQ